MLSSVEDRTPFFYIFRRKFPVKTKTTKFYIWNLIQAQLCNLVGKYQWTSLQVICKSERSTWCTDIKLCFITIEMQYLDKLLKNLCRWHKWRRCCGLICGKKPEYCEKKNNSSVRPVNYKLSRVSTLGIEPGWWWSQSANLWASRTANGVLDAQSTVLPQERHNLNKLECLSCMLINVYVFGGIGE